MLLYLRTTGYDNVGSVWRSVEGISELVLFLGIFNNIHPISDFLIHSTTYITKSELFLVIPSTIILNMFHNSTYNNYDSPNLTFAFQYILLTVFKNKIKEGGGNRKKYSKVR
jgi:hypothetical protein